MGASELNQLWQLTRENEKTIAVLAEKLSSNSDEVAKLREDNEKIKAILNRAIGAKTFAGVIGAVIGAIFSAVVAWICGR